MNGGGGGEGEGGRGEGGPSRHTERRASARGSVQTHVFSLFLSLRTQAGAQSAAPQPVNLCSQTRVCVSRCLRVKRGPHPDPPGKKMMNAIPEQLYPSFFHVVITITITWYFMKTSIIRRQQAPQPGLPGRAAAGPGGDGGHEDAQKGRRPRKEGRRGGRGQTRFLTTIC